MKKRVAVWRKGIREPGVVSRSWRGLKKNKLVILGALIVVGTYLVDTELKERAKDRATRIGTAEESLREWDNNKLILDELEEIRENLKPSAKKEVLAKDDSMRQEMTSAVFDKTMNRNLAVNDHENKIAELVVALPESNERSDWETRIFSDDLWFVELRSAMLSRHMNDRHALVNTMHVTGQYILEETQKAEKGAKELETEVREAAEKAKDNDETQLGFYGAVSVSLYVIGWSIGLRGKLSGETPMTVE